MLGARVNVDPSAHIAMLVRPILLAGCLWAVTVTAQEPVDLRVPYGARVDVGHFAYRRDLSPGGPGLTELALDAAVLAHTRPDFADLRIVSADGRQVQYLVQQQHEPLSVRLSALERHPITYLPAEASPTRRGERTASVTGYLVRLPYANLPARRLLLATTARVFERCVWVLEGPEDQGSRPDDRWTIVGTGVWSHADPDTEAPTLAIEIRPLHTSTLHLAIDEGDNSALPLTRPVLELPNYHVRFVRPDAAPLQLVYGNHDIEPPRYDLALLARRLLDSPAALATVGPEGPTAAPRPPAGAIFLSALALAVVVLIGLIVRLLRPSTKTTD